MPLSTQWPLKSCRVDCDKPLLVVDDASDMKPWVASVLFPLPKMIFTYHIIDIHNGYIYNTKYLMTLIHD